MDTPVKQKKAVIINIADAYRGHKMYHSNGKTKSKTLLEVKVDRVIAKNKRRIINGLPPIYDYSKI